jgi:bifunctional DNase/RNase
VSDVTVHELTVVGVRVELPSNQPIVLLKETLGDRYLPIWIGAVEATAIALAQQGVVPARPLTHDLLKDVIDGLGAELAAVTITDLRDGIYFADLRFRSGATVSARPSDAIALAIRVGTTIYADESVLAEAGVAIPDDSDDESEVEVVERFREFLDQVSPEDFETGS